MNTINISCECPFCGEETVVTVFRNDYEAWKNGALAQDAFPYLPRTARETLISGLCNICQEETFGA